MGSPNIYSSLSPNLTNVGLYYSHLKLQHSPPFKYESQHDVLPLSGNYGKARHKVLTIGSKVGSTPEHKPNCLVQISISNDIGSNTTC